MATAGMPSFCRFHTCRAPQWSGFEPGLSLRCVQFSYDTSGWPCGPGMRCLACQPGTREQPGKVVVWSNWLHGPACMCLVGDSHKSSIGCGALQDTNRPEQAFPALLTLHAVHLSYDRNMQVCSRSSRCASAALSQQMAPALLGQPGHGRMLASRARCCGVVSSVKQEGV